MTRYTRRRYGGVDWHHPSVHALMADHSHDRDPFDVVRVLAREMIADARDLGWAGPPFDPVLLASIQSIRARASDVEMESDALIHALPDASLEIVWNNTSPPTRRNFSVCHELGHTLFPDAYDVARHRSGRRCNPEDELERLCDAAAAEILMPVPEFADDVANGGLDVAAIRSLALRYAASPEAVARRITQVSERPCAAVLLTLRLKPKEERRRAQAAFDFGDGTAGPTPKLRVDYAIPSKGIASWFFPPHKSVPDASCAYTALSSSEAAATETWNLGAADVRVNVQAISIPADSEGRGRVLALVARA